MPQTRLTFDHVGIFVGELERGERQLSLFLPICRRSPIIEDTLLKVKVRFLYDPSDICYELVAPYGEGNPVDVVLKTRKNVLNHVAYRASEFDLAMKTFDEEGAFKLGPERPAVAFGGRRVVFFFTPLNFIVELIEN